MSRRMQRAEITKTEQQDPESACIGAGFDGCPLKGLKQAGDPKAVCWVLRCPLMCGLP